MEHYLDINRKTWNEKVKSHLESDFYDVASFIKGKNSINDIEKKLLGNVEGKSILHLQCHFGQDSLSLQRMGAQVTGVNFSIEAINAANELKTQLHLETEFLFTDIYTLPDIHQKKYDIVFTSYGTIGWLPNLEKWANVVRHFLKSDGVFIMADFHPVVWMYDNNFEKIHYSYFKSEAIVEEEAGTYAAKEAAISTCSITWNHGLAEIFMALKSAGLALDEFYEYDYSPYNCFNGAEMYDDGKYRIKSMGNKIPMVYSLKARISSF
jgi:SAM-dependent methyltransferase